MDKTTYQGIPIGIEIRRKLANEIIYYVRYGKQEQRAYAIPYNPKTAGQQRWRTVFKAGVREWHTMTPAEKEVWIKEAKKHRTWSPFITFMSAWLKYLWREVPMRVPDYDSLWLSYTQGEEKVLTHNLGGNPDDYLIKLEAKNPTSGIHNIGVGSRFIAGTIRGFVYGGVTADIIKIKRYGADTTAPQIRVKIWRYA